MVPVIEPVTVCAASAAGEPCEQRGRQLVCHSGRRLAYFNGKVKPESPGRTGAPIERYHHL
jgi:hypothetical protein